MGDDAVSTDQTITLIGRSDSDAITLRQTEHGLEARHKLLSQPVKIDEQQLRRWIMQRLREQMR